MPIGVHTSLRVTSVSVSVTFKIGPQAKGWNKILGMGNWGGSDCVTGASAGSVGGSRVPGRTSQVTCPPNE